MSLTSPSSSARVLRHRLDLFDAIEDEAKDALLAITHERREVAKGERIRQAGGPATDFWCVAEGWFYSSGALSDGGRQVYAFHLPGDIMGLQDLGWEVAVCDMAAATKGALLRIDKEEFREVVGEHPVLAAFFMTFGIYDHTRLIDQLRVVGRMPAIKRVAHLLLQLASEQAEPDGLAADKGPWTMLLPIDQSLIGDAVGLTNISVSRMMGELEERGLILRSGRRIRLPDVSAIKAFCDYTERRRSVPLSWLLRAAPTKGPLPH